MPEFNEPITPSKPDDQDSNLSDQDGSMGDHRPVPDIDVSPTPYSEMTREQQIIASEVREKIANEEVAKRREAEDVANKASEIGMDVS